MGPGDVHALCLEFLAVCEEAVATTVGGAIGRSFISPGPPSWDCCPQLSVHAGGPVIADTLPLAPALQPGMRAAIPAGTIHLIGMVATVIRCAPIFDDGSFPDAAAMTAAARMTNEDVWAIWNHVRNRYQANQVFMDASRRRELFFDPAAPLLTAGGCGGWQIPVRVQLGGY